jgi:hypothetical protein
MNTRTDELHEAKSLVRALQRCQLRNDGDRRFVQTWRSYLDWAALGYGYAKD